MDEAIFAELQPRFAFVDLDAARANADSMLVLVVGYLGSTTLTVTVVGRTAGGRCAGTVRGAPLPRSLRGALFATDQASLVEGLVSWRRAKNGWLGLSRPVEK